MNMQQAELVLSISRTKSIGKSAEAHHLTVSAVSQSLSNLESELGYKLFERSRRGTVPTSKGVIAIQLCEDMLKGYAKMKALNFPDKKSIRIASIPCLIPYILKPVYEFRGLDPQMTIDLVEKNNMEILEELKGDRADFGYVAFGKETVERYPDYEFIELDRADLVVVGNRRSAIAAKDIVLSQDLADESLILYSDPIISQHIESLKAGGINPNIVMSTNNVEFIAESVNLNYAITLAPTYKFILQKIENNSNLKIIPYGPNEARSGSLWLVYRKSKVFSPLEKEIASYIDAAIS